MLIPVGGPSILELGPEPATRRAWFADVWNHRDLLRTLARKDFHTRYKRASFGVLWAVALPLVQACALAAVFSRFKLLNTGTNYTAYVLSGVLPFGYFTQTIGSGATAIVDGSGLADKIWFPRAILPLVVPLANAVGLVISMVILLAAIPILGVPIEPTLLLLLPAIALMVAFTAVLCLALSALHVYFRDVRFIVQGILTVLFFVTPIAYNVNAVGSLARVIEFNPLTGILALFRLAAVGEGGAMVVPVTVAVVATLVLGIISVEAHRVHDRLFIDLL
jgi:ABC-type polysaccharide/polyol phosphate export permease